MFKDSRAVTKVVDDKMSPSGWREELDKKKKKENSDPYDTDRPQEKSLEHARTRAQST